MRSTRCDRAFTLVEILMVCAALALLAAIMFPILGSARRSSRRVTCLSNLRQIGLAYQMYVNDHGYYPDSIDLIWGRYISDKRLLICPDDVEIARNRMASSYGFRSLTQAPDFTALPGTPSVDPNTVLATCTVHARPKVLRIDKDDSVTYGRPDHPFHLVLRANGAVQSIPIDRIRKVPLPGSTNTFLGIYPDEPGYDDAR